MEIRFIFATKTLLHIMCVVVVITFLITNKNLRTKSWSFSVNIFGRKEAGYKYILLWTNPNDVPFTYMGEGRSAFLSRKCPYTNCIVTANKSLLSDYTLFDVIAFHGPQLTRMEQYELPLRRSLHQKYVFASIESAHNYPLCSSKFDGYFNWTWTYKLDSEVRWGYIIIRDSEDNIVGPKKNMKWKHWYDIANVSKQMKEQLSKKRRAVAWFVSNCQTRSRREAFALALQRYLIKYNLTLDIYGECGPFKCPRDKEDECYEQMGKEYYFYLAFENALSEDYVTEKLLIPLQNNVVPIVYGGADYTRFLPDGSYLDARKLGLFDLGDKIHELITFPEDYVEYFKWKNHYSYHKMAEKPETNEYCSMCALLNNERMLRQPTVYEYFQDWWDPPHVSC